MMLEWVKAVAPILTSWPVVGLRAIWAFRKPLLALLEDARITPEGSEAKTGRAFAISPPNSNSTGTGSRRYRSSWRQYRQTPAADPFVHRRPSHMACHLYPASANIDGAGGVIAITPDEIVRSPFEAFRADAETVPPLTPRGGNAVDSYDDADPFDPARDEPTDAYIEGFAFWGLGYLDARSWRHYLPRLISYAFRRPSVIG